MQQTDTIESALTTLDVALILNVTTRKVQDLILRGDIKAAKIDNQYRIAPSELQRFLNEKGLKIAILGAL